MNKFLTFATYFAAIGAGVYAGQILGMVKAKKAIEEAMTEYNANKPRSIKNYGDYTRNKETGKKELFLMGILKV